MPVLLDVLHLAFFHDCSIEDCDGRQVDDVAHGRIDVDEVNGLVQTNLNRADSFAYAHFEHHAEGSVCGGQVGEYQSVDLLAFEACEGE